MEFLKDLTVSWLICKKVKIVFLYLDLWNLTTKQKDILWFYCCNYFQFLACEVLKVLSCHLSAVLINWRSFKRPEIGKYNAHLQEGLEGWSRELQSGQTTLVPGEVRDQIILSAPTQCMQDNQDIKANQYGLVKGRTFFTNLISLYNKVNCLRVDVVYLDFRKAFDTVPNSILLEKLTACDLER